MMTIVETDNMHPDEPGSDNINGCNGISINFLADERLLTSLSNRVSEAHCVSQIAEESLRRYFALLYEERRNLSGRFTLNELLFLLEIFKDRPRTVEVQRAVAKELTDSVEFEQLSAKYQVNGGSIMERAKDLSPGAAHALADAINRWYANPDSTLNWHGLMVVGLVPA